MNPSNELTTLISGAARYLSNHLVCDEDGIVHRGRLSYLWTLLRWLEENAIPGDWREQAKECCSIFQGGMGENANGHAVILPGSAYRRNYSTHAIDCGIFLDSVFDLYALTDQGDWFRDHVDRIAREYVPAKLSSPTPVHNQYLWLSSGFSRWLASSERCNEAERRSGIALLEKIFTFFFEHTNTDGYAPYYSGRADLDHITTYYHSRCLAFCGYSLDLLGTEHPGFEEKIAAGARFLARLYYPCCVKCLSLETKRYYFHGTFEAGSHPYDIFVFWRMYQKEGDPAWRSLAHLVLCRLIECQDKEGGIGSRPEQRPWDWQCRAMRSGHIAWLTRVPVEFFEGARHQKTAWPLPEAWRGEDVREARLFMVGPSESGLHFLPNKSPLTPLNGQRALGLQSPQPQPICDLLKRYPWEYRARGGVHWKHWLRRSVWREMKRPLYKVVDCAIYKRRFDQALMFLNEHILGYLITAAGFLSTAFCTNFRELSREPWLLKHDLTLADVTGQCHLQIGYRTVAWSESSVTITDHLTSHKRYRVLVPQGWRCVQGGLVKKCLSEGNLVVIESPCDVVFELTKQ